MGSFSQSGVACGVVSTTRLLESWFVTTYLGTCSDERRARRLLIYAADPRLLLSDAVHAAAEGEDATSVSTFNSSTRVEPGKKIERGGVIRVIEDTHDDETVAHVVVDVREVGPVVIDLESRWCGDFDNFERPTGGISGGPKKSDEFLRHLIVGVCGIVLTVGKDETGTDERSDNIDVATRTELAVIAGQPTRQPNGVIGPELGVDFGFDLLTTPARVSVRVELHRLGKEHGARAVDVDAATFVGERRMMNLAAALSGDVIGHSRILFPGGPTLRAPSVKNPVNGAESSIIDGEGRADVAHPRVVEWALNHSDAGTRQRGRYGALADVSNQRDRFVIGDGLRDVGPREPRDLQRV